MNTTTNTTAFGAAGFSLLRLTEHITSKMAKVAGVNDREIQKPRIKTTRHGPNQIFVIPTNQASLKFCNQSEQAIRAPNPGHRQHRRESTQLLGAAALDNVLVPQTLS